MPSVAVADAQAAPRYARGGSRRCRRCGGEGDVALRRLDHLQAHARVLVGRSMIEARRGAEPFGHALEHQPLRGRSPRAGFQFHRIVDPALMCGNKSVSSSADLAISASRRAGACVPEGVELPLRAKAWRSSGLSPIVTAPLGGARGARDVENLVPSEIGAADQLGGGGKGCNRRTSRHSLVERIKSLARIGDDRPSTSSRRLARVGEMLDLPRGTATGLTCKRPDSCGTQPMRRAASRLAMQPFRRLSTSFGAVAGPRRHEGEYIEVLGQTPRVRRSWLE